MLSLVSTLLHFGALVSSTRVQMEAEVAAHDPKTSSWVAAGRAPADEVITLTAVLEIEKHAQAALEKTFWAVSDPQHARYGQYLTKKQLAEVLAVPDERVARVRNYFLGHGATSAVASDTKDVITITASVAAVERALDTTIGAFTHVKRTDMRILRARQGYSLPSELAPDCKMVGELLQFPALRSASLVSAPEEQVGKGNWPNACDASGCKGLVTPAVLGQRYAFDPKDMTPEKGSMAVAEFQGQYFRPEDNAKFSTACHASVNVTTVIGGDKDRPGVEAELDIQYIKGVAPGVDLTVIYANSYSLLNWATKLMGMASPPLINSVSYGNDEKQQSSKAFMDSVNTAFMKAGTMGLSILFASGDQGVCGREGCGFIFKTFKPDFPGGSPYHTSVGGTDFATESIGDEMAWTNGGGGFSNHFDIPAYQASAVAAFKNASSAAGLLPPQRMWNNTGRGYPDVSALGGQKAPYCVYVGRFAGVAGTSASCPVVAGIFAKLNSVRLAAGKPPLGFLNPLIYQLGGKGFHDVTQGKNSAGTKNGFTAIKGWDAATGWGTPIYEDLVKLI